MLLINFNCVYRQQNSPQTENVSKTKLQISPPPALVKHM